MSLWQKVGDYYDATTGYVSGKIEGVQEWWGGDDQEQLEAENSGIPGTNDQTGGTGKPLMQGVNWTAISALVGAAALASKFLK
ncbi:hypothetical protein [Saccharospirillum salsuginis]|uniref:Uncharacterized protein n=1 Tax=Saccharospirillum salsuginis TaxID=418750 RepID=A0A918K6S5_9GAMM|nr:hypothetical protein [Saccharospirillum salsuginis]GGX52307.1 hypothetical protein GCM10007392_19550 [Saccharospirillum salsuginis]